MTTFLVTQHMDPFLRGSNKGEQQMLSLVVLRKACTIVHYYQEQKYPLAALKATLGKALLREDATFHMASEGVLYLIDTHLLQYAFEMYQAEAHACFDRAEGYLAAFGNF